MRTIQKIPERIIESKGVQALANRPNQPRQYGVSGLSQEQLKTWFDQVQSILVAKVNETLTAFQGVNGSSYIGITGVEGVTDIEQLIATISSGYMASSVLKLKESSTAQTYKTLQTVINGIASDIALIQGSANDAIISVSYNSSTGVLTFTTNGGTTSTIDLPTESIIDASQSYFDENTNKLKLKISASGQYVDIDMGDVITNAVASAIEEIMPDVVTLSDDQTLTDSQKSIVKTKLGLGSTALPSVTPADNGKVLTVVGGLWEASDPEYPEPGLEPPVEITDLSDEVQTMLGKAETALQEHQSLSAYRTSANQDTIDNGKVDKVAGKGLSTEDYTTAEKTSVASISSIADRVTTIEGKESGWDGKSVVSGTNDGTNWTELTVNGVSKAIPQGGGSSQHLYQHLMNVQVASYNVAATTYSCLILYNNSATPFTYNTLFNYMKTLPYGRVIPITGSYAPDNDHEYPIVHCTKSSHGSTLFNNEFVDISYFDGTQMQYDNNRGIQIYVYEDTVTQLL